VLLPLEITTGLITRIAMWGTDTFDGMLPAVDGSSPIKEGVRAPVALVEDMIGNLGWDGIAGPVLLAVGLALIFVSLWQITHQMKEVMSGRMENAINAVLSKGGGVSAMAVGMIMTVAVQSSSITTSILVPLVAAGVLTLRNAFPVTLGANLGTTVTALLASVAAESADALTIALAHVTFNLLGILIFYPIPALRRIPLLLAQRTAAAAVKRRTLVFAYLVGLFVIVPLGILLVA
jgi:solute carrier family 34 (sodium-dependent phosphate cotransporter)